MGSCLSLSILGTGDSVPPTDQNLQVIPDLSSHSIPHVSANATGSKLIIYAGSKNFFWLFVVVVVLKKIIIITMLLFIYYLRESECNEEEEGQKEKQTPQ